jgi:excisionase family DNA binding protein
MITMMIGIGEVARQLKISVDTARAWSNDGRLRAERSAAGHRLFSAVEIEKLVEKREVAFKIRGERK